MSRTFTRADIDAAVAVEREACAAEVTNVGDAGPIHRAIAARIRSRGPATTAPLPCGHCAPSAYQVDCPEHGTNRQGQGCAEPVVVRQNMTDGMARAFDTVQTESWPATTAPDDETHEWVAESHSGVGSRFHDEPAADAPLEPEELKYSSPPGKLVAKYRRVDAPDALLEAAKAVLAAERELARTRDLFDNRGLLESAMRQLAAAVARKGE